MKWEVYIRGIESADLGWVCEFCSPVGEGTLSRMSAALRLTKIPTELEELYHQTNGVKLLLEGMYIGDLIWPVEKVLQTNREYRQSTTLSEIYSSHEPMLFFSDSGCGDLFGFSVGDGLGQPDVFVWNHEEESRTWVAPDLKSFVAGWLTGEIHI